MTALTALQFTFTPAQQEFFASISADVNPMHMNSVAARRTQSGRTVVHGMHEVVRALDLYASASPGLPLPSKLAVRFPNPYMLGTPSISFAWKLRHLSSGCKCRWMGR